MVGDLHKSSLEVGTDVEEQRCKSVQSISMKSDTFPYGQNVPDY